MSSAFPNICERMGHSKRFTESRVVVTGIECDNGTGSVHEIPSFLDIP